ncbi:MAG: TlpA family protein disulfide reductase [Cellvibrionaceae bacterium]|nr:TlpA family protein disulfide reductase [Motiliproteus sp.]MCW9052165.1 TlpA family protein disulfide reductase [Motiliproteus sp.]
MNVKTYKGVLSLAVVAVLALASIQTLLNSDPLDSPEANRAVRQLPFVFHETPKPLPNTRFQTAGGETTALRDFRGQLVLLNLWATWCGPCREEMPALDQLQAQLGGSDFTVVALSTDQNGIEAVQAFFSRYAIESLETYVEPSAEVLDRFAVRGLPTSLLIDRYGREIGRRMGATEWDSASFAAALKRYIEASSRITSR